MFGGKRDGIGHHQRQITATAGARHLPGKHVRYGRPFVDRRLDGVLGPGTVFAVQYRIHRRGEHGDLRRERGPVSRQSCCETPSKRSELS